MFFEFLRFELRYWLRGMMVWIFLAIFTLIFFGATVSDNIQVGTALGNTHRNAPYVVQSFYGAIGLLSILMTTAFVDSAASRDFSTNTSALLFSKPIKRRDYLAGRFLGAILVAMIPSLGVSLGILLAGVSPWVVPETLGPRSLGSPLAVDLDLRRTEHAVLRSSHLYNLGAHTQYALQFHWHHTNVGRLHYRRQHVVFTRERMDRYAG